jgi:branched-chain amino acid transport system ATP-binding protein
LLKIDRVAAQYGQAKVLRDVSFDVARGEIVSVVGANGAGKTTLVKIISGLLRPTQGQVVLDGEPISGLPPHQIVLRGIVQVPEGRRLFADMTVLENLLVGSTIPAARAEREPGLERAYRLFPILRERRRQLAGTLSGGEQQMLAIARGLMARPRLLILDEPSLGLAPRLVAEIFGVIGTLNREGLTVLLIEQNVKHSLAICAHGIVLENGRITLAGRGEALLRDEHTRRAYLGL